MFVVKGNHLHVGSNFLGIDFFHQSGTVPKIGGQPLFPQSKNTLGGPFHQGLALALKELEL
jgi:hypothetical protein